MGSKISGKLKSFFTEQSQEKPRPEKKEFPRMSLKFIALDKKLDFSEIDEFNRTIYIIDISKLHGPLSAYRNMLDKKIDTFKKKKALNSAVYRKNYIVIGPNSLRFMFPEAISEGDI